MSYLYTLNDFKKWILQTARTSKDHFKITQITWPQDQGLSFFDYGLEVTIDSNKYYGNGTHSDADTALCKAVAEVYERFCVRYFELANSNGCAVHFDQSMAKKNAQLELIERDAFLTRFISGAGFAQSALPSIHSQLKSKESIEIQNYDLGQFHLNTEIYFFNLTRLIFNSNLQIFGMGVSSNAKECLFKSEVEALRQYSYQKDIKTNDKESLFENKQYENIKFTSFDDHGDLALTKLYYEKTKFLFDQNKLQNQSLKLSFDQLETDLFKLNNFKAPDLQVKHVFKDIPLHFVQCTHEKAQSLFIGQTKDHLNPKRFNLEKISELNLCPHPFR